MNQPSYPLSKNMSIVELVTVFEQLLKDATELAQPYALQYAEHNEPNQRAQAMFYLGKVSMLQALIWGLGDTPELEGIDDPTISAE